MKIHLLSLTVVVLCIAIAHSSPFPYWLDEIEDLNKKSLLELQEQDGGSGSSPDLRCFICTTDCANEEELVTCLPDFNCSTVTTVRNDFGRMTEDKVKVCLPSFLCSSDFLCRYRNQSGDLASCNVDCCGDLDGCNGEPTSPPTAALSTAPPSTPTTTPAPQTFSLTRNIGILRSPGFSKGSYPPNLDVTWIIPGSNVRGLRLEFLTIDTESGVDKIKIKLGNTVVRTLSGVFRSRGKRSLLRLLYQEDNPCYDDDEADDDVDYFSHDTPYDRLAAVYDGNRRQSRARPPRPRVPCVYVRARGRQISINFSSDGNDTGQRGFLARFTVYRGRGDDK